MASGPNRSPRASWSGYTARPSPRTADVVYVEPRGDLDDDSTIAENHMILVPRNPDGWGEPRDLTMLDGIRGEYPCLLADRTLYFETGGDLFRAEWQGGAYSEPVRLDVTINTDATEFGPYVEPGERWMLFTRSVDGDEAASGLYVSRAALGRWGAPRRLDLPYGWSPVLSPDGRELVYTSDCVSPDIDLVRVSVPAELLR